MPGVLRIKTVSRGQGHSVVRAAAYCGRRRLIDHRTGRTHNYTRRPGLAYSELMLPRGADRQLADSGRLWNAVEAHLRRINARLARELILGLPRGASLEAQARLVRGFLDEAFVSPKVTPSTGMCT
ncbi:MAG: MobA/MobL family protein [Acidiferrobacter sp.]